MRAHSRNGGRGQTSPPRGTSGKALGCRAWPGAGRVWETERRAWMRLEHPGTGVVGGMRARARRGMHGDSDCDFGASDGSTAGAGWRCGFAGRDDGPGSRTGGVGATHLLVGEGGRQAGSAPAPLAPNVPLSGLEIHANPGVQGPDWAVGEAWGPPALISRTALSSCSLVKLPIQDGGLQHH